MTKQSDLPIAPGQEEFERNMSRIKLTIADTWEDSVATVLLVLLDQLRDEHHWAAWEMEGDRIARECGAPVDPDDYADWDKTHALEARRISLAYDNGAAWAGKARQG